MSLRQSVALLKGCQKIAIGLMVLHAIGVLVVWVWALSRPHMVEPIEIRVANLIALWREGYLPYGFADRLPAVWNPYGFVYEWLCSLRWGTLHPYWNGRLLSIMAAMLTALCLLLWSHQQTGSIKGGVVATLLLLTAKPIFAFGHLCRVDMLGVALSMLGFVWVMGGRCGLKIGLGILMMVLAFHVKVTFVAAPVACCLAFWQNQRHRAMAIGLLWAVGALGGLALLQWWTKGAYLFQAQLANTPSLWTKPIDMLTRPLTSSPFWMLALLFFHRSQRKLLSAPESLYCLCSLIVAGVTSTNPGSSWNYLMEFYGAIALLTVRALNSLPTKGLTWQLGALLLCYALFSLLHTSYFMAKDVQKVIAYVPAYQRARSRLAVLLRDHPRLLIFGSSAGMDALLSFGKANLLDLPDELAERSQALMRQALQAGSIDMVLFGDDLKPWHGR
jgi:hypothetical protein